MDASEYWIGKNIDIESIWNSFDSGKGYIDKYYSMETHKAIINFDLYSMDEPIFNFEAIYKSIKSAYHDTKEYCFSNNEYNEFWPMYLYEVKRGTQEWVILGELSPLILFGYGLIQAYLNLKFKNSQIKNLAHETKKYSTEDMEKKLGILKDHFPNASPFDAMWFIKADTLAEKHKAIEKLINNGFTSMLISEMPNNADGRDKEKYIDVTKLLE